MRADLYPHVSLPRARATIRRLQAAHPDLHYYGWGQRSEEELAALRAEMVRPYAVREFIMVEMFLVHMTPIVTWNTRRTSYGVKHAVEAWLAANEPT